jgi:hypothetical protein
MLLEVLYRREAALAWDFKESGRISREVIPLVVIDTNLLGITRFLKGEGTGDGAGVGTSGNARRKGGGVLILRR